MYVFIQKTTMFISVGVDITFFFLLQVSRELTRHFKLVLLVAGGRAIAGRLAAAPVYVQSHL